MKKRPEGCGCFIVIAYVAVLVAAFSIFNLYCILTQRKENSDNLVDDFFPLAVALAPVAILVGYRWAQRLEAKDLEEKERKREKEAREYQVELEYKRELWRRDPEEARRYEDQQRLEAETKVCSECGMRIPRYARICPYCRTRYDT